MRRILAVADAYAPSTQGPLDRPRQPGRPRRRALLPGRLLGRHPALGGRQVRQRRPRDPPERHLSGRAPLGGRAEVRRAPVPDRGQLRRRRRPPPGRAAADRRPRPRPALDSSPATRATVARLLRLQADYHSASQALFNAVDEGDQERVLWFDHSAVDPVFGVLADVVYRQAAAASASALAHSAALRGDEVRANRTIAIAVLLALLLVAFFGAVVVRYGRRLDAAVAAEVERLAEMAITDPLTGLRNHRAFHEDVARELQLRGPHRRAAGARAHRPRRPQGRQRRPGPSGRRRAPAGAGRRDPRHRPRRRRRLPRRAATSSRSSCPTRARGARSSSPSACAPPRRPATHGAGPFTATAGIAEALALRPKDELVREADLALIGAKRIHQDVVIYGPDLAPGADGAAPRTSTTRARWPARWRARSTPRTPTRAAIARRSRSSAA